MICSGVAVDIVTKAVLSAGDKPDTSLLSIYKGSTGEDIEYSMYYYGKFLEVEGTTVSYHIDRTLISSKGEGDIVELISLMKEYNSRLQDATDRLLEGEYNWIDIDTFRRLYRVGSDYGYCHITKIGQYN